MNLIEKLGGYAQAIKMSKEWESSIDGDIPLDTMMYSYDFGIFSWGDLQSALLKYRRQHNIYEVGDKVIKTHPKNTILWPVLGVYKNGGVWLDYKGFCWKPPRVRHVTPEEIKAGKRL